MITLDKNHIKELCNGRKMLLSDLGINDDSTKKVEIDSDNQLSEIAKKLNVTVKDLFENQATDKGIYKLEADNGYKRVSKRKGKDYYTYEHLVTVDHESNLMPLKVTLHCKNDEDVQLNPGHGSKEMVYILKGQVQVDWVDEHEKERTDNLNIGDSIYITPNTPHSFMALEDDSELLAFNY